MEPDVDVSLTSLTSLAVGGRAAKLYTCTTSDALLHVLAASSAEPLWVLGYGANVLVSDAGLPGRTVLVRTQEMSHESTTVIADAGVWWDDLVQYAIGEDLWGLELMSAIPGGVGAAVAGNIAAYGQAVADTLAWVEIFDTATHEVRKLLPAELGFGYRTSKFQTEDFSHFVITRVAFTLSTTPTQELVYQSALDVAEEHNHDVHTLDGRRQTVLETRRRAGSLWDYRAPETQMHTAGSFFRNPMTDSETAERIMAYDETGKSAELLRKMNQVHGGDQKRVSAAHVLLAAGFERGQTWGNVRLHPDHILKIENIGGATAQEIYDVVQEIMSTVKTKLGIELTPEVRFLGEFH